MTFRLAIVQMNPTAGDLEGNTSLVREGIARATKAGADLVVFPELALSGYPPEDLLLRASFIGRCREALTALAMDTLGITAIVGAPVEVGGTLANAAVVLAGGKMAGMISKTELPNYGVFDEKRYFTSSGNGPLVKIGPAVIGVTICEDIWLDNGIADRQATDGANLLVNISGSPFREGVLDFRRGLVSKITQRLSIPFVYCNMVGGQDELIFDGRSFAQDAEGVVTAMGAPFDEDFMILDFPSLIDNGAPLRPVIDASGFGGPKPAQDEKPRRWIKEEAEEVYEALTLGVRDYVAKNGFPGVVIGLSGGIDSALTCAIAVDALGPSRVMGVLMPSPYSSQGSLDDASRLAENMGIRHATIPIGGVMESFDMALNAVFVGMGRDVTEENIQARIRGSLIMAISNKMGLLALTTGNKSETAMGYCTLYGDMAGGLAVIKDLYKVKVYELSRWRNRKAGHDLIPKESIEKEPSAELRPGQKDTDSLPPYTLLDPILKDYIEHDLNASQIAAKGRDRDLVLKILKTVDQNEYKRRQGPIGLKITAKAFGRDRRLPITCKYKEE